MTPLKIIAVLFVTVVAAAILTIILMPIEHMDSPEINEDGETDRELHNH